MNTIKETLENEIVINKSKFITTLIPISSVDEAASKLNEIRKKYYDATHNCFAYIIGASQEIQKFSDDGEPQGTSGSPMIEILKKNNLTNILVVVTRYFGGILLGAGGLVRAYSDSVSTALKKAEVYSIIELQKVLLSINYTEYNLLSETLNSFDIINQRFSETVDIQVGIPLNSLPYFKEEFENVTRGKGILILDKIYLGTIKLN